MDNGSYSLASASKRRMRLCGCSSSRNAIVTKTKSFDLEEAPWGLLHHCSIETMSDHLLLEILLKLPVKLLHRCKTVSKRWLSLISSPLFTRSFILTRLPGNSNNKNDNDDDLPTRMLLFQMIHGPPLVCSLPLLHDDFTLVSSSLAGIMPSILDFIPPLNPQINTIYNHNHVSLLDDVNLACTYGGLALLQGRFKFPGRQNHPVTSQLYHSYYVCNPVTKQWVELPFISTTWVSYVGFTCYYRRQQRQHGDGGSRIWADVASYDDIISQNADFDPNKIDFTVVLISREHDDDDAFTINVYSSEIVGGCGLTTFRVPFPPGCNCKWYPIHKGNKVVFCNGKFHWRGFNCIAAYDPFNKPFECDIIPLPPTCIGLDTKLYFFEACQGCLRLSFLEKVERDGMLFSVWDLADYANKVWVNVFNFNCGIYPHILYFGSFVGGALGDKIYMCQKPHTLKLFDVTNNSVQHIYTYPGEPHTAGTFWSPQSFFSSPWPTPVPKLVH